jgi:hypothetical protein
MSEQAQQPKKGMNPIWIWIAAAIVIIGVIVVLANMNKTSDEPVTDEAETEVTEEATETADEVAPASVKATLVTAVDPDQALPYTSALSKYADRRISFSTTCQATPAKVTYKSGTKLMIDNRGSVTHQIRIGSALYTIPAYNFAFILLSSDKAITHTVDCDSNKNVSSISIQV